jgi:DNA (cytosine-5)-methyltransferase 1
VIVSETLREHPRPGSNSNGQTIAYPLARRGREGGSELEVGEPGVYNALRAGDGGSSRLNQVMVDMAVRRLTPRECERLQGLPDDWTRLDDKTPDSRRYSALGDAVTANVAAWIGGRIKEAA